eukprot:TRINITY_DN16681_c0_g1_i1.p1 TRINITY_DN16681_c0_g1~~TRINITY_DN16681_c0_g1_i1.p1  ORF type:complete len:322 (+),score=55.66 TRINITY_DN16681_c0_g1_i1:51-968(+)
MEPAAKRQRCDDQWQEHWDPTSKLPYWHNPGSGESTWNAPPSGAPEPESAPSPPAAAVAAAWERHWCDEHSRPFWHNALTGDSSWTDPAEAAEQPAGGSDVQPLPVAPSAQQSCPLPTALPVGGGLVGRVTRYHPERGFGFIVPEGGGAEIFVHCTAFGAGKDSTARLVAGESIHYTPPVENKRGQMMTKLVWGPAVDEGQVPGMLRGVVVSWNSGKGFGFIMPEGAGSEEQVFVHVSALRARRGRGRLVSGRVVYYSAPEENTRKPGTFTTKTVRGPGVDAEYDPSGERIMAAAASERGKRGLV